MGQIPSGLHSTILQSLLSNKVGLFNKFSVKVGQGFYFCAWAISILKWERFFFFTEKISAVSMRCSASAHFLSCVRSFYTTKPLWGGPPSLQASQRGWGLMGGQGGNLVLCWDPRSCYICSPGLGGQVTSAASLAGDHIEMRFMRFILSGRILWKHPKC